MAANGARKTFCVQLGNCIHSGGDWRLPDPNAVEVDAYVRFTQDVGVGAGSKGRFAKHPELHVVHIAEKEVCMEVGTLRWTCDAGNRKKLLRRMNAQSKPASCMGACDPAEGCRPSPTCKTCF